MPDWAPAGLGQAIRGRRRGAGGRGQRNPRGTGAGSLRSAASGSGVGPRPPAAGNGRNSGGPSAAGHEAELQPAPAAIPARSPAHGKRRAAGAGRSPACPLAQWTSSCRCRSAWPGSCRRRPAGRAAGGRRFRPDVRRQIRGQELLPQRRQQLAVQPAAVLEPDFQLRRMHVHVDRVRAAFPAAGRRSESGRSAAGRGRLRPRRAARSGRECAGR